MRNGRWGTPARARARRALSHIIVLGRARAAPQRDLPVGQLAGRRVYAARRATVRDRKAREERLMVALRARTIRHEFLQNLLT